MSRWGKTRHLQRGALALLLLLSLAPVSAKAEPRFASLNVCADQLLLMLADREEIASLSYHAVDPNFSFYWRSALGLPVNRGQAEELIAARPSLVLGGTFSNPATQHLLDRLGIAVLPLEVPTDFAGIRAQILAVAEALGHRARGQALAAELDRRLDALEPAERGQRPLAAVYQENGISAGRGTLVASVVEAAGFDNLATRLGFSGYAALSLEELILHRPSLLVTSLEASDAPSLARQTLEHPALKEVAEHAVRVTVPAALWVCPGPYTVEAVELIARERARISAEAIP
ncbi:MAG TPA: ABC transporter substrate-binding protein [Alphaproteobacteria bacterium]|nr:ABC transporter substrate-binding protein [Alphaproteobacteria bacterium]